MSKVKGKPDNVLPGLSKLTISVGRGGEETQIISYQDNVPVENVCGWGRAAMRQQDTRTQIRVQGQANTSAAGKNHSYTHAVRFATKIKIIDMTARGGAQIEPAHQPHQKVPLESMKIYPQISMSLSWCNNPWFYHISKHTLSPYNQPHAQTRSSSPVTFTQITRPSVPGKKHRSYHRVFFRKFL